MKQRELCNQNQPSVSKWYPSLGEAAPLLCRLLCFCCGWRSRVWWTEAPGPIFRQIQASVSSSVAAAILQEWYPAECVWTSSKWCVQVDRKSVSHSLAASLWVLQISGSSLWNMLSLRMGPALRVAAEGPINEWLYLVAPWGTRLGLQIPVLISDIYNNHLQVP